MKKIVLTFAAALCMLALNAQPQGGQQVQGQRQGQGQGQGQRQGFNSEERMKTEIETLTKTLTLTDEQKTKVTEAYTAANKKQTEMREKMQAGGDRTAMRTEQTKIQTERNEAIKKALTAEQVTKYDAYLKEQEAARAQRGQGGFQGGQAGQGQRPAGQAGPQGGQRPQQQ